jgi:hypothetical protein
MTVGFKEKPRKILIDLYIFGQEDA